jgi:hypothetical protein
MLAAFLALAAGSTDRSVCATRYWAGSGKTRRWRDLLRVYHGELAEWTLSVYKLLIARKKVGKPRTTTWYLI